MEPEPPGAAFFTLEPESAPGPWPPGAGAGATQKSGGSATLDTTNFIEPRPVGLGGIYNVLYKNAHVTH